MSRRITRGYGLTFGMSERKRCMALSTAFFRRGIRRREADRPRTKIRAGAPITLEAAGFVSHLKLPHYVDFQAELAL